MREPTDGRPRLGQPPCFGTSGELHHDQICSSGGAGRRCHRRRDAGSCRSGCVTDAPRRPPRPHRQAADADRGPRPRFRHDRHRHASSAPTVTVNQAGAVTCGDATADAARARPTSARVQRHRHQQARRSTITAANASLTAPVGADDSAVHADAPATVTLANSGAAGARLHTSAARSPIAGDHGRTASTPATCDVTVDY